jgi:ribosomal protein L11 methyltransferase
MLVANLDRQTILDCIEGLSAYAYRGAILLLSGLLTEQLPEISRAFSLNGIYARSTRERDGWLALEAGAGTACDVGME